MDRGSAGIFWTSYPGSTGGYYYDASDGERKERNYLSALSLRCIRDNIVVSLPVVSNITIPEDKMTSTMAECFATVSIDGGAEVSSKGFCWNTTGEPTVKDNVIPLDGGIGNISCSFDIPEMGVTYYIRAYAINEKGVAYSPEINSIKSCPSEFTVDHVEGINGAPETKTVTYHSVSTKIGGGHLCWLTQNLGADRQAVSYNDASEASSGWYWQFNRKQGYKNDGITRTPVDGWVMAIKESAIWYSWTDPCKLLLGAKWRVPSIHEWRAADGAPQNWESQEATYNSILKLHSAGYLDRSTSNIMDRGVVGYYWSCNNYKYYDGYYYNSNGDLTNSIYMRKTFGLPLRCVMD